MVVLLQTLAAVSAKLAVHRIVLELLFVPHVSHSGADGRGVARPGCSWG